MTPDTHSISPNPDAPDPQALQPAMPVSSKAGGEQPSESLPLSARDGVLNPAGENPAWSGGDVLVIAGITIFFILVFSILAAFAIASITHQTQALAQEFAKDSRILVPVQTLAYIAALAFMTRLVKRRTHIPFWQALQWNWPGGKQATTYFLGGIVLAMAVQILSAVLPMPKSLPVDDFFRTSVSAYLMTIFGIGVAPLLEEIFFRGFLYPVLARGMGVLVAVAVTAAGFALVHQQQLAHAWGPMLMLFIVGLVLTITRAKTQSVASSWMIHVGYNTSLFAFVFAVTEGFHNMQNMFQ